MLNLYPYHLMVNSVNTSGFKYPCSVGAKKKKETCSTKGSCQTILSHDHNKCFFSIFGLSFMFHKTRCKVIVCNELH